MKLNLPFTLLSLLTLTAHAQNIQSAESAGLAAASSVLAGLGLGGGASNIAGQVSSLVTDAAAASSFIGQVSTLLPSGALASAESRAGGALQSGVPGASSVLAQATSVVGAATSAAGAAGSAVTGAASAAADGENAASVNAGLGFSGMALVGLVGAVALL